MPTMRDARDEERAEDDPSGSAVVYPRRVVPVVPTARGKAVHPGGLP